MLPDRRGNLNSIPTTLRTVYRRRAWRFHALYAMVPEEIYVHCSYTYHEAVHWGGPRPLVDPQFVTFEITLSLRISTIVRALKNVFSRTATRSNEFRKK